MTVEELRDYCTKRGIVIGDENEHILYTLASFISEAQSTGKPLKHVLFIGARGAGKTTMMRLYGGFASEYLEMGADNLNSIGTLRYYVVNLDDNGALGIDEFHKIKASGEQLGEYMTDPETKVTIIGATMRPDRVSDFLRSRFYAELRILPYSTKTLKEIAMLRYPELEEETAEFLAERCDGTPRDLVLKKIETLKAYAVMEEIDGKISVRLAEEFLERTGIDEMGLEPIHREYIRCLGESKNFQSSLNTIASKLGLPSQEIESDIERRLVRMGFVEIGTRGRVLTEAGQKYYVKWLKRREGDG